MIRIALTIKRLYSRAYSGFLFWNEEGRVPKTLKFITQFCMHFYYVFTRSEKIVGRGPDPVPPPHWIQHWLYLTFSCIWENCPNLSGKQFLKDESEGQCTNHPYIVLLVLSLIAAYKTVYSSYFKSLSTWYTTSIGTAVTQSFNRVKLNQLLIPEVACELCKHRM